MPKISPITWDQINRLGVDDSGRLYWEGKAISTEQHVVLQWWVSLSAIVVAICAFISMFAQLASFFFPAATVGDYVKLREIKSPELRSKMQTEIFNKTPLVHVGGNIDASVSGEVSIQD
jgi:hypothetical protein